MRPFPDGRYKRPGAFFSSSRRIGTVVVLHRPYLNEAVFGASSRRHDRSYFHTSTINDAAYNPMIQEITCARYKGVSVLVADDSAIHRRLSGLLLEMLGCTVDTVTSGP